VRSLRILFAMILAIFLMGTAAYGLPADAGQVWETTILFTHDLHSHFLPQRTESGGTSGGYAKLKTVLDQERSRYPDALVVDAGDFTVGSLFQTLSQTQGAELRTMGAMGYDACTVGNHEFDSTGLGFAQMLNAATLSGDRVPAVLMANYKPSPDNPNALDIQRAMTSYGVKDGMLLERGGVTYGIFGLMGTDASACAPSSGFTLQDPIESAQQCVQKLREQGAQFIICLSHGGTNEKEKHSEDQQLAQKVDGIDLIISGHTHTTLPEPIVEGDTYIVSAGAYCENLGTITLRWDASGEKTLVDYHLTPISEDVSEEPEIATLVESWKKQVNSSYLSAYNLTYDEVLTTSDFDLMTPEKGVQEGNALGALVADSYFWAVCNLEADSPNTDTVTLVADGVLRAPLYAGPITTSQAFDVLSMGVGENGSAGYPLVACYLTGKELRAVMEIDASVTPRMPEAQLYFSGVAYSFNVHRFPFNRVTEAYLHEPAFSDGGLAKLENDKLYRVVSGMYSAQMLSVVKEKSFGLLSIEPKDSLGRPITDFSQHILRDSAGNEIKEWYALAAYLRSFGEDGVPEIFRTLGGGKTVSQSWNPIELWKNANWITWVGTGLLILAIALAVVLVKWVLRLRRRRRYGGGHRSGWFGRW
jgi:5'-nucleotidase/UDP-sugar diphosphatase